MTFRSTHPTSQHSHSPTSGGPGATSLLSALASLLGAASFFTQRLAHTFAYDSLLGEPVFALPLPRPFLLALAAIALALPAWALAHPSRRPAAPALLLPGAVLFALAHGPLYHPAAGIGWLRALVSTRWYSLLAAAGVEALAVLTAGLVATAILYRTSAPRRAQLASVAHGSARFASRRDLAAADLLSGDGIVLGAVRRHGRTRLLTDRSGDHALIVMPPGAGKTTGPIATTLLNTADHSALVLDPKGELYALTAGWRAAQGHEVVRFAPHGGIHPANAAWNPLDEVPRGRHEEAVLAALAGNLVSHPAGARGDDHWTMSARSLLRCLILHELYSRGEASLAGVRQLLTCARPGLATLDELFDALAVTEHDPDGAYGWRDEQGRPCATHPEVIRLARSFRTTPERERGSIVSTLNRFLDIWGDSLVAAATGHSDWSLSLLTDPRRPATVYVTAPFNELARLAPLLRILVALLVHRLTDDSEPYRDVAVGGRRRVLLVLDEFASLGRLPLIEQVLAFLRGYGVTAMLAVQDLGQLYSLYGLHETFSGTCGLHVASATANLTTRGEVSRRAGDTTLVYPRLTRSGGWSKRAVTSRSQTEVRRPLLTEGEVGTLPPDTLVVSKQGHPAILARRLPYWRHRRFARRAGLPLPRPLKAAHPFGSPSRPSPPQEPAP